jgi:hypothetical protein
MTEGLDDLAARKALLTAQADLSRLQVALAWQDLRSIVSPAPSDDRSAGTRRAAAFLVGVAAPLIGRSRFTRALRFATIAVTIVRALRSLRARSR